MWSPRFRVPRFLVVRRSRTNRNGQVNGWRASVAVKLVVIGPTDRDYVYCHIG